MSAESPTTDVRNSTLTLCRKKSLLQVPPRCCRRRRATFGRRHLLRCASRIRRKKLSIYGRQRPHRAGRSALPPHRAGHRVINPARLMRAVWERSGVRAGPFHCVLHKADIQARSGRTLLIGALCAILIGYSCPVPPRGVVETCTSPGCYSRTAATIPIEPKRVSFKPEPTTMTVKPKRLRSRRNQ